MKMAKASETHHRRGRPGHADMKRPTLETTINAATFAAFLCVLGLSWAAVSDDHKVIEPIAQAEYRAELAAASMCAAEGKTAVWNGPNEIECLREQP